MVIKYPGIESYQTKRKKVSSESHSFKLQTAVEGQPQWQPPCYNKAGFQKA